MVSANALLPSSLRLHSWRITGQWNNVYNFGPCKLCEGFSSPFADQNSPITCSVSLWLLTSDTWTNSICLALQSEQQKFHFTPIYPHLLPRNISLCFVSQGKKNLLLVIPYKLCHLKKHLQTFQTFSLKENEGKDWMEALLFSSSEEPFQPSNVLCNGVK